MHYQLIVTAILLNYTGTPQFLKNIRAVSLPHTPLKSGSKLAMCSSPGLFRTLLYQTSR